jgi:hypothetical protein
MKKFINYKIIISQIRSTKIKLLIKKQIASNKILISYNHKKNKHRIKNLEHLLNLIPKKYKIDIHNKINY